MDTKLGILLCLIIIGFLIYYLYTSGAIIIPALNARNQEQESRDDLKESFEVPGPAAQVVVPVVNEPPRKITQSGPNPPAQMGEDGEAIIYGEPVAQDPYAEQVETANAPEHLRQPDRMFRPAPPNTDTMIANASGTASPVITTTEEPIQAFNSDFVENRGEFMNGIFANDIHANGMAFSAF